MIITDPGIGYLIIKTILSQDRFIFILGIPVLLKRYLNIGAGPNWLDAVDFEIIVDSRDETNFMMAILLLTTMKQ